MKRTLVMLLVGFGVGSVVRAGAHHSVSARFDENRTMTIEGTVERLVYQNPHVLMHLVVMDTHGDRRTWAVEFDAAADALRRQGWKEDALRPGELVRVCGNPGRDPGEYRLRMLTLERMSDGLSVGRVSGQDDRGCASSDGGSNISRRPTQSSSRWATQRPLNVPPLNPW